MNVTDFASIESDKENIMPLKGGRSAKKLAEVVSFDPVKLQEKLELERRQFEETINQRVTIDSLDDPIEPYIEYIKWTHANYTTGNINDSGLIKILERTTHDFKDDDYYKNEIRYFRVWLEYINYSDRPGEVFKYLYKKKIGSNLALFYENYAQFYELNDQWDEAETLLTEGIQLKARPFSRLLKYYEDFKERKSMKVSKTSTNRIGLLNSTGGGLSSANGVVKSKRNKIAVFTDESSETPKSDLEMEWKWNHLDSIENSKKENVIKGTSWKGQTLKQEINQDKTKQKIEVFSDQKKKYPITSTRVDKERNRTEIFDFNLELFLNKGGKPQSMVDIMSIYYQKFKPVSFKRSFSSVNTEDDLPSYHHDHEFVTPDRKRIKLIEEPKDQSKVINTPTVTFTTKQARQEIMEIFDKSLTSENQDLLINKDFDALSDGGLSDFVTETITKSLNLKDSHQLQKTPDHNRNADDCDLMSSPFLENPNYESTIGRPEELQMPSIIDPFDQSTKLKLMSMVDISTYSNCHITDSNMNKLNILNSVFKVGEQPIHGNKHSLIEFEEGDLFCITMKLGNTDNSNVFLSEKYDGELNAVKIHSPSNIWGCHIYQKINKETSSSLNSHDFIKLQKFYKFNDESYTVLPYLPQGNIFNLTECLSNHLKTTNVKFMDEQLVIYFTIQLIRRMLKLHSMDIVHCNLSPENCMLNINKSKVSYDDLIFVDFDNSIDLSLLPNDVLFQSDSIDSKLSQMMGNISWKYEIDYFGLANVIHSILFNKEISITKSENGEHFISESIKKYWQKEMWLELFNILLNPSKYQNSLVQKLERILGKFESWFNLTVDKRRFLQNLNDISSILELRLKKKTYV